MDPVTNFPGERRLIRTHWTQMIQSVGCTLYAKNNVELWDYCWSALIMCIQSCNQKVSALPRLFIRHACLDFSPCHSWKPWKKTETGKGIINSSMQSFKMGQERIMTQAGWEPELLWKLASFDMISGQSCTKLRDVITHHWCAVFQHTHTGWRAMDDTGFLRARVTPKLCSLSSQLDPSPY